MQPLGIGGLDKRLLRIHAEAHDRLSPSGRVMEVEGKVSPEDLSSGSGEILGKSRIDADESIQNEIVDLSVG